MILDIAYAAFMALVAVVIVGAMCAGLGRLANWSAWEDGFIPSVVFYSAVIAFTFLAAAMLFGAGWIVYSTCIRYAVSH